MFNFFPKPKTLVHAGKLTPTVLIVLDGWGIAPDSPGNAITQAQTPNYKKLLADYPHGQLLASGESVGLPANEVGNTEVGHLNMGAGRLILQDLKKIDKAIEDGSFFENRSLYHASTHAQKNNSKVHIMGLISPAHVHSSIEHLYALLDYYKRTGTKALYLHLFTDGRDSSPNEAVKLIPQIEEQLKANGLGKIATICGRYYAMDRDRRWERTQKAYDGIVKGVGEEATSAIQALQNHYAKNITDEFIEPIILDKNGLIQDNDAVVFFNFRIDRPRQLTMAFVVSDFSQGNLSWEFDPYAVKYAGKHTDDKEAVVKKEPFPRGTPLKNLFFVTMTQYQKNLPVSEIAFPPQEIPECISVILSEKGIKQAHIAESEKERFVTYYFNGLREEKLPGEDTLIVPSQKVATYDKRPEMSIANVVEEFKKTLNKDMYQFIIMNIANPDMVAHTGKLKPAIKAIEETDKALGEIIAAALICNANVIITADHGNAEELITYPSTSYFYTSQNGIVNTDHSTNPVPVIIISKSLFGQGAKTIQEGSLADIGPTILSLMHIQIPPVMTGKNLLL